MLKKKSSAYAWQMRGALFLLSLLFMLWLNFSIERQAIACGSRHGGPIDNPIVHQYSDYTWTEKFRWSCVYNITDFAGSSDQERFNLARDIASQQGGGVVYFPAGTYEFNEDLVLKEGVILRGEMSPLQNAKEDNYAPQAKLIFPRYHPVQSGDGTPNKTAFKTIKTAKPDSDKYIGLVNLDINRAAITFGDNIDDTQNSDIIIYGIRHNNAAAPNLHVPNPSFQSLWLRFSDLLAANIKVIAHSNVLIANNRLNDHVTDTFEQANYQIQRRDGSIEVMTEGWKVPFSYTNHYGISVNRFKNGSILFDLLAMPEEEPGLFRKGIVIRDNWVYHTMSVGIHASGDGLLIKDNVVLDAVDKRWYTDRRGLGPPYLNEPDRSPPNITYENRAIDWSGWNVTVEGNDYRVYRHFLGDTEDQSVDGEGILIQECCGGTKVRGIDIVGNIGNSYIGLWKVPEIADATIIKNEVFSDRVDFSSIYVNADTNLRPHQMNSVHIENNVVSGGIRATAGEGGKDNKVRNNRSTSEGSLEVSCHVELDSNIGFKFDSCLPSDD